MAARISEHRLKSKAGGLTKPRNHAGARTMRARARTASSGAAARKSNPQAVRIVAKDAPGRMANHVHRFVQGWRLDRLVFTGGIAAEDPKTGKLVGSDIVTQAERVFQTLRAILEEAGSSLDKVLKVNVFFVDFADKARFETVYGKYFPKNRPGRTSVTVTKIGIGTLLEVDAIAYV